MKTRSAKATTTTTPLSTTTTTTTTPTATTTITATAAFKRVRNNKNSTPTHKAKANKNVQGSSMNKKNKALTPTTTTTPAVSKSSDVPTITFTATIEGHSSGGAFVRVPGDIKTTFGSARPKVSATFDGHAYRGSIAPYGGMGCILIVLKNIRESIGKQAGDKISVVITLDAAPRTLDVPSDLIKALEQAGVRDAFEASSYTNRKEIVQGLNDAKKEETRQRRMGVAVASFQSKN